jgi:predicted acylesterase/phospholipase RssA
MSSGGDLAEADYTEADRSCDVVMKGGITSGVVYPHAVCELARDYRFKNVGGTSAGAIAAAATAAAEYGRQCGGFNRLAGLPGEIGAEGKLASLFQPQRRTRRLYRVLIAALDSRPKAALVAAREHLVSLLIGAALGAGLLALALVSGIDRRFDALVIATIALGTLLTLVGAALGVVGRLVWQVVRAVPDNMFGICSGGPGWSRKGKPALTPWLTDLLNETACLPPHEPLTFGHLWAGPGGDRAAAEPGMDDPFLGLAMMTTNLTNRRAHELPGDTREWFFDPAEFRRLFPAAVVDWMEAHPPRPGSRSELRWALARPLLPLPEPADLPVVVATRMSLSFPVLLSAVPLWSFDMTRREPAAERCWFSDGGISSNFPVHFFDRMIPRWPTFAINLRPFRLDEEPEEDQYENTWMVESNGAAIADWWYRLPDRPERGWWKDARLAGFLMGAVRTMQNRVDEAQMRAPGCRDRIAHVKLSELEGGMNLTMPPPRIEALTERGRAAAVRLHEAFTADAGAREISWDNHRWVRLRTALAAFEDMHDRFAEGYDGAPEGEEERYRWLLERGPDVPPRSYRLTPAQRRLARRQIRAMRKAARAASGAGPAAKLVTDAPRPLPEGRIVPRD